MPDPQRDLRPLLEAGLADIPAGNAIETAARLRLMARDAPSFLRGSAAVMVADLRSAHPTGPVVPLCGDAHPDNFALFAPSGAPRVVDINDFDEAAPGPWHWDVRRLATGLLLLGADRHGVQAAIGAHARALHHAARHGIAPPCAADHPVDAVAQAWARLALDRPGAPSDAARAAKLVRAVARGDARDPAAKTARATAADERDAREALTEWRARMGAAADAVPDPPLAVFRRQGGLGSRGRRNLLLLMRDADGGQFLLQIKAAGHAMVAPRAVDHAGQRVADAASRAAHRSALEGWTQLDDAPAYVRVFKQNEAGFDLPADAAGLAHWGVLCAAALARFHLSDRLASPLATGRLADAAGTAGEEIAAFAQDYAARTEADRATLAAMLG